MDGILNRMQRVALGKLGISSLNAMQTAAVEHCRSNSSMVLLSPTGTGKTLAFLLPLLERLKLDEKAVQAVVVLPTRELARQVFEVWRSMATPFHIAPISESLVYPRGATARASRAKYPAVNSS